MNSVNHTVVQERVRTFFSQSIERRRLAHAYIFYGPEGTGKTAFAIELAKHINCESSEEKPCHTCPSCVKIQHFNHPDIRYIFPRSSQMNYKEINALIRDRARNPYKAFHIAGHKNIAIESIRELKNEAKYATNEAARRVFIIEQAEYFSREAANSFLKLLEEPPSNLLIILTTEDINALLETIRSRCQPVYFPLFSDDQVHQIISQYETVESDILPLIRIARNNVKRVFQMMHKDHSAQRDLAYRYLRAVAGGDVIKISEIIDEMTRKRDKNFVLEILELIVLWLRDAVHHNILEDQAELINIDYSDSIRKFAEYYAGSPFDLLIERVERTYREIEHNAHPALSLTNLALDTKDLLMRKTNVEEVE